MAAIPVTLQDSLLARLDRLSSAKDVAQRAAVLGREFPYALLAAIAGMDDGALQQGLARLVEAELVFVRGVPPEATYTFKHALVQEAAYESLLKRTRQQLHAKVVDVLLEQFPERAAAEPELVARHAELAGRIGEAISHYQRAGEQAQARSAHEEALRHFRQALALLITAARGGRTGRVRGSAPACPRWFPCGCSRICAPRAGGRIRAGARPLRSTGRIPRARCGASDWRSSLTTRGKSPAAGSCRPVCSQRPPSVATRSSRCTDTSRLGTCEYYQGKAASALQHCEAAFTLYDQRRHHAVVSTLVGDPGVVALGYGGVDSLDARLARSRSRRTREAVALARTACDTLSAWLWRSSSRLRCTGRERRRRATRARRSS